MEDERSQITSGSIDRCYSPIRKLEFNHAAKGFADRTRSSFDLRFSITSQDRLGTDSVSKGTFYTQTVSNLIKESWTAAKRGCDDTTDTVRKACTLACSSTDASFVCTASISASTFGCYIFLQPILPQRIVSQRPWARHMIEDAVPTGSERCWAPASDHNCAMMTTRNWTIC